MRKSGAAGVGHTAAIKFKTNQFLSRVSHGWNVFTAYLRSSGTIKFGIYKNEGIL